MFWRRLYCAVVAGGDIPDVVNATPVVVVVVVEVAVASGTFCNISPATVEGTWLAGDAVESQSPHCYLPVQQI